MKIGGEKAVDSDVDTDGKGPEAPTNRKDAKESGAEESPVEDKAGTKRKLGEDSKKAEAEEVSKEVGEYEGVREDATEGHGARKRTKTAEESEDEAQDA